MNDLHDMQDDKKKLFHHAYQAYLSYHTLFDVVLICVMNQQKDIYLYDYLIYNFKNI